MKQETLQEAVLAARMQVQQRGEALLPVTVYSQLTKNHPEYVPCEEIHIAIKEELKKNCEEFAGQWLGELLHMANQLEERCGRVLLKVTIEEALADEKLEDYTLEKAFLSAMARFYEGNKKPPRRSKVT